MRSYSQRSWEDVKRSARILTVLLYVAILIGLAIKWHFERDPVWTYLATAGVAAPCLVIGYFLGIARGRYFWQKKRTSYELPQ